MPVNPTRRRSNSLKETFFFRMFNTEIKEEDPELGETADLPTAKSQVRGTYMDEYMHI